jgi:hypothetical protein
MKPNVGNTERIIRVVAGLAIIGVGVYYQSWWGAIGLVPIATGAIGFCPAYLPFGISTCKTNSTPAE